jgi:protein TonB
MFGMSLAIEIALLVLLIAVPILTTVAQPPLHQNPPAVVTYFGPRPSHQPTEHLVRTTADPSHRIPNPFMNTIAPTNDARSSLIEGVDEILSSEMPPDYPPGAMEAVEVPRSTLPVGPPHVAPREPTEKRVLKISGPIIAAQLISKIKPKYPYIAIQTRREGTVLLHAIISRDGQITSLDVLSGDPLPVGAALDAVRQWRYRPTILNGEPVEVETTITVVFQLRQ